MSVTPPDIALFIRSLYGGGAERITINLARGFIQRGFKVDIVLPRAEGPYLAQVPPEATVVDLKTPWVAASLPKLVQYLRKVRPTALLATLHYPCEIAILAKRLAGVPTRIIVSEQNTLSVEAQESSQLSVRATPLAARFFYPWADGIIATSKGVAADLSQVTHIPMERIQVIHNPIIVPELFAAASEPIDHSWFKPDQPPVIIAAGRLHPQKDFPTLIRAFAQVQKVRPARLMIFGVGPEQDQLIALINELGLTDKVALPGFVKNLYAYVAKAAVFVLSSAWEGLPTVLVETMAVGTPIVSTNCKSGPDEILANGKYGSLTPVGDSQAMATAILEVLAGDRRPIDPAWLDQFTPEICVQKYLDALGFC